MFLFLDHNCMCKEHKNSNQQHEKCLIQTCYCIKMDIYRFQHLLIEINRNTRKNRMQSDARKTSRILIYHIYMLAEISWYDLLIILTAEDTNERKKYKTTFTD